MKNPWEMTPNEFSKLKPQWKSEVRTMSFTDWAKSQNIEIPQIDLGKVLGMTMLNNKTAREKGVWKSELQKYARYARYVELFEEYIRNVPTKIVSKAAIGYQMRVLHKRQIRMAIAKGETIPQYVLSHYPELGEKDEIHQSTCRDHRYT